MDLLKEIENGFQTNSASDTYWKKIVKFSSKKKIFSFPGSCDFFKQTSEKLSSQI